MMKVKSEEEKKRLKSSITPLSVGLWKAASISVCAPSFYMLSFIYRID